MVGGLDFRGLRAGAWQNLEGGPKEPTRSTKASRRPGIRTALACRWHQRFPQSVPPPERPAPVGRALRQGNPSGRDRPLPRAIQTLARLLSEEEGRPKLVMHNVRGLRVAERSG